jgi:hypothetical protein
MANVNNPNGFVVARSNSVTVPLVKGLTGSNVTLADGDFVAMLTTGLIALATSASATLHGVCAKPVTGAAGVRKECWFVPALPTIEFEGQCSGTLAQTDIGEAVDIEGGTGVMQINEDANSTKVLAIVGLGEGLTNALGANARARVIVAKSSYPVGT